MMDSLEPQRLNRAMDPAKQRFKQSAAQAYSEMIAELAQTIHVDRGHPKLGPPTWTNCNQPFCLSVRMKAISELAE